MILQNRSILMQSQDSQSQAIQELLTEFRNFQGEVRQGFSEIRQDVEKVRHDVEEVRHDVEKVRHDLEEVRHDVGEVREELARSRQEFQEEVRRWDNRFFEFSRDSLNRANTLIASATISVIAGVILLLLRS